jgi:hypothetical protein
MAVVIVIRITAVRFVLGRRRFVVEVVVGSERVRCAWSIVRSVRSARSIVGSVRSARKVVRSVRARSIVRSARRVVRSARGVVRSARTVMGGAWGVVRAVTAVLEMESRYVRQAHLFWGSTSASIKSSK